MQTLTGAAGVLTIDLAALAHNWRLLARRAAPAKCAAAVTVMAYVVADLPHRLGE